MGTFLCGFALCTSVLSAVNGFDLYAPNQPLGSRSYNANVLVSEFDYHLPDELIAQEPLVDRAASRMLRMDRRSGDIHDASFQNFPELLHPGDLVVFNNTRVFPARLYGRRSGAKAQPLSAANPASRNFLRGRVEVLLTKQISQQPNEWECLVRPGRKIGVGENLFFGEAQELVAEVVGRGTFGERRIRFVPVANFFELIETLGHVPLPPYISREDRGADRDRYQTVYARERGSVAAPTAGLHFTPALLNAVAAAGHSIVPVTLHVGPGTFRPVETEEIADHRMDGERFHIPEVTANAVNAARAEGRPIVAVGTTVVRTLEWAARQAGGGSIGAGDGESRLFLSPGDEFLIVTDLITNFHLPRSTLLMLVAAFAGRDCILAAYEEAIALGYRFYSYGDAMLITHARASS